jgi:uncharacterized protein
LWERMINSLAHNGEFAPRNSAVAGRRVASVQGWHRTASSQHFILPCPQIRQNRGEHTPMPRPQAVSITVDDTRRVSGLLQVPGEARVCYVLAHGAGAGMSHPFLAAVANGLAQRGIATLRYQFPYMEQGSKRPDAPRLAQATVRAAVAETARLVPELALIAGGKSFGGRMTSQAQAASPLPCVRGLAFLGFPLHPSGQPSDERGYHCPR